ncbi:MULTISPECIES: F0F1 ATP synthase subunit gamma [unclassified Pseudoalteromonas]|uniref:F0F1 ATP synthase subunit gamma n=1 Tax=unclassified Pseudoalteromonas TaxID=194690 RepID=UPI00042144C9|nr:MULTISPECIES: F0F1 ATP synthase subunit gamma [unclassified Pseudoalteromonas]
MSNSAANLRHKIASASDLQGVVKTMKALAASSIGQYEKSISSLTDYYRAVELGLSASLHDDMSFQFSPQPKNLNESRAGVIIFGSDQGLVGQFNESITDFTIKALSNETQPPLIWVVGARAASRLTDAGFNLVKVYTVPVSVHDIDTLVRQIQIDSESSLVLNPGCRVLVFYNQPKQGALYECVSQRLLPLDEQWRDNLKNILWPTKALPEVLCKHSTTIRALIREYIFISLYRACAESLVSENSSRLGAMQRAEKNIEELLDKLSSEFNTLRQSTIDEELSDVLAGYELLNKID